MEQDACDELGYFANLASYYHHCPWTMALGHPVINMQL
jgi:hypothetical protein